MTGYVIRRLGQAIIVLFLLSILFFLLARYQYGNPCQSVIATLSCEQLLHVDQPLPQEYASWITDILHGNFGTTPAGQSVSVLIAQSLPPTVILMVLSIFVQQLLAIPLGVLSAARQYSRVDSGLTLLSYAALSIPSFVLGIVLLRVFSVGTGWFPTGKPEDVVIPLLGSADWWSQLISDPGLILGDMVRHFALPVAVLTALGIANDSRIVRSAMLQVLHQEYVRTARAKGVNRRNMTVKHAFKNALLPVITNIGLYLPTLIGGTIIVEVVFNLGGLGSTFALATGQAIASQGSFQPPNVPLIIAILLLASVVVLLANLFTDLLYGILDPRIRVGGTENA